MVPLEEFCSDEGVSSRTWRTAIKTDALLFNEINCTPAKTRP